MAENRYSCLYCDRQDVCEKLIVRFLRSSNYKHQHHGIAVVPWWANLLEQTREMHEFAAVAAAHISEEWSYGGGDVGNSARLMLPALLVLLNCFENEEDDLVQRSDEKKKVVQDLLCSCFEYQCSNNADYRY